VIVMDASVLIAHLNPGDPHHQAATAILLTGTPGQMLVHTITLAEVLVGGVRIGHGAAMLDDLRATGIAIAPHGEGESLRLAELRANSGLKLPDCCVLDVAIHYRARLATFDEALAAAARKRSVLVEG
jgi:toxin FitB